MSEINAAGIALVKQWEGLYLSAYTCAAGVWTIGWGHTGYVDGRKIAKGMTITKDKAERLLQADLAHFMAYVDKPSYVPLTAQLNDDQKAALCSFAFNCGTNSLRTLCRGRSVGEIGEALLLYVHAGGKYLTGLAQRRKAERALFLGKGVEHDMDTLRKGDKGQQVKVLQLLLNHSVGEDSLAVDGSYGGLTEAAVIACQEDHLLDADGICGAKTWAALLG